MANSYTRVIRGLGGGSELSYSQNLFRHYPRDGREPTLATIPGYRRTAELGGRINGIFRFGEVTVAGKSLELLLVHAGTSLYGIFPDAALPTLSVAGLADAPSSAFRFGAYLYLLDGSDYRRVSVSVTQGTPALILERVPSYEPIEANGGEPYEAMNLLSERSYEQRRILSLESYGEGSPGLRFEIYDATAKTARVIGGEISGELRIPSFTRIGTEYYRVTAIAPSAFEGNGEISGVRLGLEVREVGDGAFRACTALTAFLAPGKLEVLGYSAFAGCTRLATLALGRHLVSIRAYATEGCTALSELLYAGEDFSGVSVGLLGNTELRALTPICSSVIPSFEDRELRFPLLHAADAVTEVTLDGETVANDGDGPLRYRSETDSSGRVLAIVLYAENPRELYEKELVFTTVSTHGSRGELAALLSRYPGYQGTVPSAVRGCRVGACYDGRIFLGGNPALPGAVFYSSRTASGEMHPGYFSVYSYFTDGGVGASLLGLLAAPTGLIVFTDESEGTGIYRHVGADTDRDLLPRIYPIASGHVAEGRYLDATLYGDEVILATTRGVSAITPTGLGETRLSPRDGGAFGLSALPLGTRIGLWLGYLAVFSPSGELWLGDGRRIKSDPSGAKHPEWWRLRGITGYRGATRLYRYGSRLDAEAEAAGIELPPSELIGESVKGEVYSEGALTYAYLDGRRVCAVWEGEEVGGEALGFSAVLFFGDELLFGDGAGVLYRFATDRRGLPPSTALSEYSEAELAAFGRQNPDYLAPEWYHFDRHPIEVRFVSVLDDCGRPGERKSTEHSSTLIGCRSPGHFRVTAVTDDGRRFEAGEGGGGELDFSALRFDALAFDASETSATVIREVTKKWHRKQYLIESDSIASPIELREISYRYAVVGKVKRI